MASPTTKTGMFDGGFGNFSAGLGSGSVVEKHLQEEMFLAEGTNSVAFPRQEEDEEKIGMSGKLQKEAKLRQRQQILEEARARHILYVQNGEYFGPFRTAKSRQMARERYLANKREGMRETFERRCRELMNL